MAVWTRCIAGLGAAALAAAASPAASAVPSPAHGSISVQGFLMGPGPPPHGPHIAWVNRTTGHVRWQRLRAEQFPITPSPDGRLLAYHDEERNLVVART